MRRVITTRGLPADRVCRAALQAKLKPAPATRTWVNSSEHNLGNSLASNLRCDLFLTTWLSSADRGRSGCHKPVLALPSWRCPCSC